MHLVVLYRQFGSMLIELLCINATNELKFKILAQYSVYLSNRFHLLEQPDFGLLLPGAPVAQLAKKS